MSRYGPITYYTSQIYPIVNIEAIGAHGDMSIVGQYYDNGLADQIDAGPSFVAGALFSSLFSYTTGLPEAVITGPNFLAGTITNALKTYTNGLPDAIDAGQGLFLAGSWLVQLVTYSNYPAEGCNASADFIAGHIV